MHSVRRFYFYLITFISLEVVIWGMILLTRTLISPLPIRSVSALLASGLSLVLVGLPIFLLHWVNAQRDALRSQEDRSARVRAIFLYGALFAVLVPVAQNMMAILIRALLDGMGASSVLAFVGANQSLGDNLVAISINLVAWAYLQRVLRSDREAWLEDAHLDETRRLYRYVWLVYGLALTVMGVQRILHYLLSAPFTGNLGAASTAGLVANGIALALVGAPLWAWNWRLITGNLKPGERSGSLHLTLVYGAALLGAVLFVIAAAGFGADLLQWLFVPAQSLSSLINAESYSLALAVPMAVLWSYFGRERRRSLQTETDLPRRAELDRLYFYLLALVGNIATFIGLWRLLVALAGLVVPGPGTARLVFPISLGAALGPLLVGLPVWLSNWARLQAGALRPTAQAGSARQSLVRRVYLYLALFLLVVGAMATAGTLLYLVISKLLGSPALDFANVLVQRLFALALVLTWLGYHWTVLRGDLRQAHKAQTDRFARFPVLIVQADDHPFAAELAVALQRESPGLPVAVHRLDLTPLTDDLTEAKAVVLPAGLATRPPEALRLWLNEFGGQRVLAPLPASGVTFVGALPRSDRELIQQTVQAVRLLAEGREVRVRGPVSAWMVAGMLLGGLFALLILSVLVSTLLSAIG